MFKEQYSARIEKASLHIVRVKKEEKRSCSCVLCYDFTEGLAEQLGGDAPALQAMLANGGESAATLSGCRISLDVASVRIALADEDGGEMVVEQTSHMSARASSPQAEGSASPALLVRVTWPLGDDMAGSVDFLRMHLGEAVQVRMDRAQGELPFEAGAEA